MNFDKPWERGIDRALEQAVRKEKEEEAVAATPKKRINIRQKGANAERQLATALNEIVNDLLTKHGISLPDKPVIQRNQNQTAVGGNDLSNCFGLGIEVKRQENLQIEQWWRQCAEAASRNGELPVLVYRQNAQAWRVVTHMWVQLPVCEGRSSAVRVRAEMKWEAFLAWFGLWVDYKLSSGERPVM